LEFVLYDGVVAERMIDVSNRRRIVAAAMAAAVAACLVIGGAIGANFLRPAAEHPPVDDGTRPETGPSAGAFVVPAAGATTATINAAVRWAARHRTTTPDVPVTGPAAGLGPDARQGVARIVFDRSSPAFRAGNIVDLSGPIVMRSNVRLEVDSGVVLRYAWHGRAVVIDVRYRHNVTVTVGDPRFGGDAHVAGNPDYPRLAGKFEIDTSRCPKGSRATAVLLSGTRRFLVSDLYTVQSPVTNGAAVIAHLAQSSNGIYRDHYNAGSPFGYGPNQLTSLRRAYIARVWTDGGTALRLETGPTHHSGRVQAFGDHDLFVNDVYAQFGNRVVALVPHCADSGEIHISGVYGLSDWEGIRLGGTSRGDATPRGICAGVDSGHPGSFRSTTVSKACIVAGDAAQAPVPPGTFNLVPPRAISFDAVSSDASVDSDISVRDVIADQSSMPFASGTTLGTESAGISWEVRGGRCGSQLPLTGW
jgi:hypothetical protein